MSKFDNYEQILCEWLANFVDKTEDGYPLVFRNNAPTIEEIEDGINDKVYCVYTVFEGGFGQQVSQPITLYSYGNQSKVFEKMNALTDVIRNGAVLISGNGVKVKVNGGNPLVQDKTDADRNVKGYYINLVVTVYKV